MMDSKEDLRVHLAEDCVVANKRRILAQRAKDRDLKEAQACVQRCNSHVHSYTRTCTHVYRYLHVHLLLLHTGLVGDEGIKT